MKKYCDECGIEFEAKTSRQRFCKGPHVAKCAICGQEFQYLCSPVDRPNTCSKVCKQKFRECKLYEKYGVINVSQIAEVREKKRISNASETAQAKSKQTCLKRYGVTHACQAAEVREKISSSLSSDEVKEKRRLAFQQHYGVDHIFMLPDYREKYGCNIISKQTSTKESIKATVMERYGVPYIAQVPEVREKAQMSREATCIKRYGSDCIFKTNEFKEHLKSEFGVTNIAKHPDTLKKAMRNKQKKSNLEIRLHNFLKAYHIEYVEEYVLKQGNLIHSFDVYLPKYKILIDADGEYWHSYLSDPDGYRVRDDGDEIRLSLVPSDHIFHLIVESDFERGLRKLQHIIAQLDSALFDYDSYLFNWCRQVGFPYYNYDDSRLHHDWQQLCNYRSDTYNENCRFGISIVNQFHRSIFDAHVANSKSPREAWDDDVLLKKVIANRLIYQNEVDPSKILKGFNISKIAAKVSVFNPVLASYICQTFLDSYDVIFDPFSGFSGRLLGVTACGKQYIGQDIDAQHTLESNEIISYLNLSSAYVVTQDVETSDSARYDALLTCPPYSGKEIYGNETVFHACDDWIDICLSKFNCRRYIFIVDDTTKYVDNIAMLLSSKSHFRNNSEKILIIDN